MFEEVLAVARAVGPLTEEHNYWLDRQMQSNVGRMFRLIGRRLEEDGRIERAENIVHFELAEIIAALRVARTSARSSRSAPPNSRGGPGCGRR